MIAVELSLSQLKDAVKQLTPSEKMELNEMIWNDDIVIPIEHQQIVNERIKKAKENPGMLLDWKTASKTLRF